MGDVGAAGTEQKRAGSLTANRATREIDEKAMFNEEVGAQDGLGDLRQQKRMRNTQSTKVKHKTEGPKRVDRGSVCGIKDTGRPPRQCRWESGVD